MFQDTHKIYKLYHRSCKFYYQHSNLIYKQLNKVLSQGPQIKDLDIHLNKQHLNRNSQDCISYSLLKLNLDNFNNKDDMPNKQMKYNLRSIKLDNRIYKILSLVINNILFYKFRTSWKPVQYRLHKFLSINHRYQLYYFPKNLLKPN